MRDLPGHGSGRRPPVSDPNRSDTRGRNGHSFGPHVGRPIDSSGYEDEPVDLVELQADDELINALSAGLGVSASGHQDHDADDRLVAILAAWKADVDADPIPELVEPDVAIGVLAPPTKRSRRVTYLRPLVAAAAVAACAMGVVSVSAHEALPGDSLWGLSKVLYSERAGQVQAAADLRNGIEAVNQKLARGDTEGAQKDLAAMAPLLGMVAPGADQDYFRRQQEFLAAKIAETPPGTPTDPTAPLRNGTTAPRPPSSEGDPDPVLPGSGTVTSPVPAGTPTGPTPLGGTGGPTDPVAPSGQPTDPARQGGADPRMLREQAPSGPTTQPGGPTGSENPTPPTTEGTPDPTTTTPNGPTASGEGAPDRTTAGTTSSPSGAISSTPG